MRHHVDNVVFVEECADRIEARGITEDEVLGALTASAEPGELGPRQIGREGSGRRGGLELWFLCRCPRSGKYLEVGVELMPGGTAMCYHAMEMRDTDRKRFRERR